MNIGGSEWIIIAMLALFLIIWNKEGPADIKDSRKSHGGISKGPGIIEEGN